MQECTAEFDVQHPNKIDAKPSSPTVMKQMQDALIEEVALSAAAGVMYSGLKHAAQSQVKGRMGMALRVGGRVGLRFVPILGTAYAAYSIYSAIDDWLD